MITEVRSIYWFASGITAACAARQALDLHQMCQLSAVLLLRILAAKHAAVAAALLLWARRCMLPTSTLKDLVQLGLVQQLWMLCFDALLRTTGQTGPSV